MAKCAILFLTSKIQTLLLLVAYLWDFKKSPHTIYIYSGPLECSALSLGVIAEYGKAFLGCFIVEEAGTRFLRNVGYHSPNDSVTCRKTECPATLMRGPELPQTACEKQLSQRGRATAQDLNCRKRHVRSNCHSVTVPRLRT